MLDWISRDTPSTLVLIAIVWTIGTLMTPYVVERRFAVNKWSMAIATAVLIGCSIFGIVHHKAHAPSTIAVVVLKSLLVWGLAYSVLKIFFASCVFVIHEFVPESRPDPIRPKKEPAAPAVEEEPKPVPAPTPPPPPDPSPVAPPTEPPPLPPPPPPPLEEKADETKRRHDAKVAMLEKMGLDPIELAAGKEAAKRQYLREIDELMK